MHLAQECHEQRRLARTGGSNDQVKRALLEDQLVVDVQAECLLGRRQSPVGGFVGPREGCMTEPDVGFVFSRRINNDILL